MRKLFFAAVFAAMAGAVSGQEVKLLEDIPADTGKTQAAEPGGEMQIIMPSEDKPAAEAKPVSEEKKNAEPKKTKAVPRKKTAKKTAAAPAVKPASVAAVKPSEVAPAATTAQAQPAVPEKKADTVAAAPVKPAVPQEKPAASPAKSVAAVKPAEKTAVPAKPAVEPAASAGPVAAVRKTEPKASPSQTAVKPAEKTAEKPAEKSVGKPAENPAAPAKPAAKPAEVAKPVAAVKKTGPKASPSPAPVKEDPKANAAPVKPVVPVSVAPASRTEAPAGFAVTKTHQVAGGDTLWDLSAKYYKDPFKWGRIYNANLGVVSNPDRIYPKNELVIPDITEEVLPEKKPPVVIGEGETVKEAALVSADVAQPAQEEEEAAPAEEPVYSAPKPVPPPSAEPQEALAAFDRNDLSEKMPKHQKEWGAGVKIVPDGWQEDGVITAKESGDDDSMEDSLSMSGAMVRVALSGSATARKGDYLTVYMKGSEAYGKDGKKVGREIQRAGMLEVVSSDGGEVKARVIDAVTAISKGYVVKKK